ncbi:MAG TPA: nucleoside hydrolase [Brevundimonas sp.]|uniref:nucleoside hydrolase n=1 Tax=Brevundimonas sp. TaxID=1871086 RepID=UPI002BAC0849|nr:nucleoside hydrolase [Brevundimonas sp.]HRH19347.1 nucleoside hydrolase [Brevundimonas sp.]
MNSIPVIIDCDPGVDDAVALFLAFASPELDIRAITTVGGNVPADKTARNGRLLRQLAGLKDRPPVHAGAAEPLERRLDIADHFHGAEGLGSLEPFEPDAPLADGSSAEAIVHHVMTSEPGTITLAVTGPMTNVALALRQDPAVAGRLKRIVAMGGSRSEGGNITASAEYNIWADPEAAHEVLSSGVEVVMLGLDVTHQVRTPDAVIETIRTIGTPAAEACAAMLDYGQYTARKWGEGQEGPMHDPCVIAYILRPDLFELRSCTIQVETVSDLTRGHTQVEFRVPADTAQHRWGVRADRDGVFDLIVQALRRAT